MREIKLSIRDVDTDITIDSTTSIEFVNELYDKCGINGITQIVIKINEELNKETGNNVKLFIPSDLIK
jgi:hypothetical protein